VREFILSLSDEDAAEVVAALADVREQGLSAARHLRGAIYEVRADGRDVAIRILFAQEGRKGRVLLALEGFKKKDQRAPERLIRLAESRLTDWRSRAGGTVVSH
jgi:phage-related protein